MKRALIFGLVLLILAIGLVSTGASRRSLAESPANKQAAVTKEQQMTRVNEEAGVAVGVTFLNPADPKISSQDLVFDIALNTHMGDLSSYDFAANAKVINDRGEVIASGFTWKADLEGSHHRGGKLLVQNKNASGTPFWTGETKLVRLELKNLGGVPDRTFEWRF